MSNSQVMKKNMVKISSKGQFILPANIRKDMTVQKGDFLKVYAVGKNLIIMEKLKKTPFEKITESFAAIAEEKKITPEKLQNIIKGARKKVSKRLYGKKEQSSY